MAEHDPTRPARRPPDTPAHARTAGFLIGPVFLVLAIIMFLGSRSTEVPAAATPEFDRALLRVEPRRTIMGDPPTTVIAGFDQRCNACHKLFESTPGGTSPLVQHSQIVLNHGINNSCANCHAKEDRERLVLLDGSSIPYAEAEMLCRQCHGPVYRDWTLGTHGKTVGSWEVGSSDAYRLKCTECHDPHSPRFEAIEPLPGPNSLRMGEPARGEHQRPNNPLRHWTDESAHDHEEAHE